MNNFHVPGQDTGRLESAPSVVDRVSALVFDAMSFLNDAINKVMGGGALDDAQEAHPLTPEECSAWDKDIANRSNGVGSEIAKWL